MKNLDNIIFIDNLPKLDLHGCDREISQVLINDFINDNIKMQNEFIVIIHGIGSGIIKNITLKTLSKNKYVKAYKIYNFNSGCTIVQLDLTNKKKVL